MNIDEEFNFSEMVRIDMSAIEMMTRMPNLEPNGAFRLIMVKNDKGQVAVRIVPKQMELLLSKPKIKVPEG